MENELQKNVEDHTNQPQELNQPVEIPQEQPQQPNQDNSTILLINNLNNRIDALNQKLAFLEANQTKQINHNDNEPLKGV